VCRDWHDTDEPWPAACAGHFKAVSTAGPQVISDNLDPTWHPATGKRISSKSKFRAETRAAGCVEVGNEKMPAPKVDYADISGHEIKQYIEQIRSRR
jgi:hypothetical protein